MLFIIYNGDRKGVGNDIRLYDLLESIKFDVTLQPHLVEHALLI